MKHTAPHYLLFTQAKNLEDTTVAGGRWRFVLEEIGSQDRIEEAEFEPGIVGERLQLLVVIRGLEAIEQASRVTLITPSKYVGRGIRMHLSQWRQNNWQWERFGRMTTIKHHDLWQRIDHAMSIHQINCRVWQFDPPQERTQVSTSDSEVNYRFDGPHLPTGSPQRKPHFFGNENETQRPRRNKIVLNQERRPSDRISFERPNQPVNSTRISSMATIIKPIGQGRAFGYAVN